MKMLIHDLESSAASKLFPNCSKDQDWIALSKEEPARNCIGCFGCWIKTPGECVIPDKYAAMGASIAKCSEVVLVSRCFYGGPSPFVKNVLDRSIPYIHPYFVMKNGETHHLQRYDRTFNLRVLFYGEDLTPSEKETARLWVNAAAVNLYCDVKQIEFKENPAELEGIL